MLRVDPDTFAQLTAAATVAVVLAGTLLSGPLAGVIPLGPADGDAIGDGSATVETVSISGDALAVTDGRFGTGMWYLRVPDAVVDVTATEGRSRLVYRLRVPALGVDVSATRPVPAGSTGRYRLGFDDPAFAPSTLTNERYRAVLTVRVQSFVVDETVYNETVSVEVRR